MQQQAILQAKDGNISVLPLARNQFDLSAQGFQDSLTKYCYVLPSVCDSCGTSFSIEYALNCHFGAWSVVGIMRFMIFLVTLLL